MVRQIWWVWYKRKVIEKKRNWRKKAETGTVKKFSPGFYCLIFIFLFYAFYIEIRSNQISTKSSNFRWNVLFWRIEWRYVCACVCFSVYVCVSARDDSTRCIPNERDLWKISDVPCRPSPYLVCNDLFFQNCTSYFAFCAYRLLRLFIRWLHMAVLCGFFACFALFLFRSS